LFVEGDARGYATGDAREGDATGQGATGDHARGNANRGIVTGEDIKWNARVRYASGGKVLPSFGWETVEDVVSE
jgi:hypothetical protein